MHFIGKLEAIVPGKSVEEHTSNDIEYFIKSIVTHSEDTEVDPSVLEEALKFIKVSMSISDP